MVLWQQQMIFLCQIQPGWCMTKSYTVSVLSCQVHTVSGQQQMIGYAGSSQIGVPPGALGEEVRVDCCLMTNDGRSVITGSSLGPPQVWDMQVRMSTNVGLQDSVA